MNLTSNLDTIRQDLRHAFRGVPRNWSFTLAAVFAIALGVGATTAVFSVVDRILFRGLPYAHDERLVSLGMVSLRSIHRNSCSREPITSGNGRKRRLRHSLPGPVSSSAISPFRIFPCASVALRWNPRFFPHWVSSPWRGAISHLKRTGQAPDASFCCPTDSGKAVSAASQPYSAKPSIWTVRTQASSAYFQPISNCLRWATPIC